MDLDGYLAIEQALIEHDPDVRIAPKPEDDKESLRYVTVASGNGGTPAEILNALAQLGFMAGDKQNTLTWNNTPQFTVVGSTLSAVTLEDHNPNVSEKYL